MTTSQDCSTSRKPGTQLDQSTAERIMSLEDNRSNSNMEPNSVNTMEDLLQQVKGLKSSNMKLSLENQALQEVQRELKSKLKTMDMMLILKEDVDRERDKVIHTFQSENTALVDKNDELMAKLRTAQSQIRDCKTACNLRVDYLEGLIWRGQSENSVCSKRTKELESLVEATEKKWLNVQEDFQNNVELTEKLRAMQTRIHQLESDSDLKVNTLEDQLRSEQVEKETCLQRTKELESLVETTEKKWLNMQEDSPQKVQKMEEDIKLLIVKSIKLQELALMSDSDKARKSEEERKVQKKQEKTEKVQREMKLKEREKQEKKKQQRIAKELIEKLRGRKSMRR
ncbi:golgin subfamily A member 6-like protein 24 [Pleuronectes platessa]|uniref:golgin subfamily A member 6-like protein 24 n=1 Tax=Pleuronectes platessa TaxID=8262 RepID=UPI00232A2696|nr:golgin subfamily A member 6-like protein 24 [Pleuronectes platessa]